MDNYFGYDLDDNQDGLWHEIERIQDGVACHHVAFKADSAHEAARLMAERLIPFIEKKMYQSDEDGRPIEESWAREG